jgi:prophage regulatory protein
MPEPILGKANRFIREKECQAITGLSPSTRWRMEQKGLFPKSRKIGLNNSKTSAKGWILTEIEAWVENRIHASQKEVVQ